MNQLSHYLEYDAADAGAPPSLMQSYPAGKHKLKLDGNNVIDLKRWPLEVFWRYRKMTADVLPIVVSLSADNMQSVMQLTLTVPTTRGAVGEELTCQMLKQKVCVKGHEYTLQEVYGLADMGQDSHDESAVGEPCVICLTDPRNTAVLPCRHLCVCEECAQQLQIGAAVRNDHCPICRGKIA